MKTYEDWKRMRVEWLREEIQRYVRTFLVLTESGETKDPAVVKVRSVILSSLCILIAANWPDVSDRDREKFSELRCLLPIAGEELREYCEASLMLPSDSSLTVKG